MKKITLISLAVAAVISFAACNTNKEEDSTEIAEEQNEANLDDTKIEDDAEFAVAAADGGMMEVKLGDLAQTNAANAEIKKFGKTMSTDHAKANEELVALAQQKNISLPMVLSDDRQKKYDELAKKTGADFDKAYIDFMLEDHKEDIKEFEEAASDAKDSEVRAWAAGKVPTLKHHLELAQAIHDAKK